MDAILIKENQERREEGVEEREKEKRKSAGRKASETGSKNTNFANFTNQIF